MDLLKKSDEEIFAIAKPFWENLVRASYMKDYGGFTVLIKQTNKEVPGEFLGRLVLGVEDGEVKIFGATIY